METASVRSARSEPGQRSHRHHRNHRHSGNGRHASRGGGSEVGMPTEHQRLRGPYETDPDTDRDDRSMSTRASNVVRRGIDYDRLRRAQSDRDSQWGETTTVVTGATSEFNYSLEDVNADRDFDGGVGYRCARYAGTVVVGFISVLAFLSPIAMIVMPKVGVNGWQLDVCGPDCEGMLIGFGFKLLILAAGSWALFARRPRSTMPRIVISRSIVLVLTFVLVFSYWLFYGVRIFQQTTADNGGFTSIVRFASSLVDALLFVHYLAVILVELRHLQTQYVVKLTRSPDGVSRTYSVGEYSVQQLASWCLDRYYRDFETYNPYLETVAQRGPRRMTEFKVYDVDGVSGPATGSPALNGLPAASTRGIIAAVARQRDSGHNDRFYDEIEYERRVRRRKARLTVAADEAFAHIKRLQREPGSTKPMDPDEAAQHIFPFMARALQKYLRITRQQPRYSMASILQHLSSCISHDMSAKAFLERYLTQGIVIWNDNEYRETQTWSVACDRLLSLSAVDGTVIELRQGDITLLVVVRRLPHFNLVEEVLDPKANKFVLRMNSETSV